MIRKILTTFALSLFLTTDFTSAIAQQSIAVPDSGRISYKRGPFGGERVRYSRVGPLKGVSPSKESTAWDFGLSRSNASSSVGRTPVSRQSTCVRSVPLVSQKTSVIARVTRPSSSGLTQFSNLGLASSSNLIVDSVSTPAATSQQGGIEWVLGTPWTPAPPTANPEQPAPRPIAEGPCTCRCLICCCSKSGKTVDEKQVVATENPTDAMPGNPVGSDWTPGTAWSPASNSSQLHSWGNSAQAINSQAFNGSTISTEERLLNLEHQMSKLNKSMDLLLARPTGAEVQKDQ